MKKNYICKRNIIISSVFTSLINLNKMTQSRIVYYDVLNYIEEKGLDVRAVFVGDGPARPMFEKMADDLGVRQFCEFTGLISKPMDLRQRLIDADIMVFPTKGEGLPRCVIEAMAVGLPCISTPVNGIPELLEKDCLFSQQDVDGFSNKASGILSDDEYYTIVSKKNIEKAKEYEYNHIMKRRSQFYVKLTLV